jgi:hypothetical protein
VITLAVNRGKATFDIIGGDADKFTLNGNKLTFKATALKDGNDATYRINIKATKVFDFGAPLFATDEQTLVVTVTNNPDNGGKFHISTPSSVYLNDNLSGFCFCIVVSDFDCKDIILSAFIV